MTQQPKPHISPSQMESYSRCGEAYRRRYIEKERIPPGIAMIRGTSVHKGAEINYGQKIKTAKDLPVEDIVDISVNTYENNLKHEGVWLNPEEEGMGRKKVLGQGKDATARLSRLFMKSLAPTIQPKFVEIEHRIELPNSTHDLLGRIDLIDENDAIDDLKTSSKRISQENADKSPQLTFYALTFQSLYKKPPSEIRYSQLLDTKTPEVNIVKTKRERPDFDALVSRLNSVLKGINAGIYTPATPGAWWCDKKWCGYHATCSYISHK